MLKSDDQKRYWDRHAPQANFVHPFDMASFLKLVPMDDPVLDFGCGYGRTCGELLQRGFRKVTGIDVSPEMINRGLSLYPDAQLLCFDGDRIPFPDETFSACILFAVLTNIPRDQDQERIINEIYRVLRNQGVLYISDYPLQGDARNLARYDSFSSEFCKYGVFRLPDGAVVRHHDMQWIVRLLSKYEVIRDERLRVTTLNGNNAEAFQMILRKH